MSKITRCAPGACLLVITSHTRQPGCQGGLSIPGAEDQDSGPETYIESSLEIGLEEFWVRSVHYNDPCMRRVNQTWQCLTNYWMLRACLDRAGGRLESAGGCWKKCCEVLWKEAWNAAKNATRKGDQINKCTRYIYWTFIRCDSICSTAHVCLQGTLFGSNRIPSC